MVQESRPLGLRAGTELATVWGGGGLSKNCDGDKQQF